MYLLGTAVLSSNGPKLLCWGRWVPVIIWCLNVNYSQTRKSGLTGLIEKAAEQAALERQRDREVGQQAVGAG